MNEPPAETDQGSRDRDRDSGGRADRNRPAASDSPQHPERQGRPGASGAGSSWERRAAAIAGDLQRWLIRTSARNMRDELGDQVKRAFAGQGFAGQGRQQDDVWATATTEPPDAAEQPPECAWCPICRAARRMAQAQAHSRAPSRSAESDGGSAGGSVSGQVASAWTGVADALAGAAHDALAGLDAILSYRPDNVSAPSPTGDDQAPRPAGSGESHMTGEKPHLTGEKEPEHEPDHRS